MKTLLALCFLAAATTLIIHHHPVWGGISIWLGFALAVSKVTTPNP